MSFWSPFPFVRVTAAFCTGILLQPHIPFYPVDFAIGAVSITVFYLILAIILRRCVPTHSNIVSGTFGLMVIGFLGFTYAAKFSNGMPSVPKDAIAYYGVITSNPQRSGSYDKVILDVEYYYDQVDSLLFGQEKILLYVKVDSTNYRDLQYGDYLLVHSQVNHIKSPSNPGEFDFSTFWANKHIYLQDFVGTNQVRFIKNNPPNQIIGLSFKVRRLCERYLKSAIAGDRELAIAMALILGVKDGLDNEIKSAYAASGAMHVLAVSGLHVGILYLFILFALKPLRGTKYGDLISGVISLTILWSYALITGFSPSVQRAVVMFSIFIIGRMFKRQRNIYNSLSFSAFLLLIINPLIIYEVGFQLSYLAVFGIVFLQPKLYQVWSPNNWLINKGWEITCVSVAAQLATFPLGIYYFHQFPTLFLLSNFIVIPTAFFALILGILIVTTAAVGLPIFQFIGTILNAVLWLMNEAVFFIQSIKFSVINGIELNSFQVVLLYLAITFFITLWLYKNFKYLVAGITLLLIISTIEIIEAKETSENKEVVFYAIRGNTAIDFRDGLNAEIYIQDSLEFEAELRFIVEPDRSASGLIHDDIRIRTMKEWASPSLGIEVKMWNNIKFMRLSKNAWKQQNYTHKVITDYLIVSNNSVYAIDELLSNFKFNLLIIDGSNSYFRSEVLVKEANDLHLNIHSTNSMGALILDL